MYFSQHSLARLSLKRWTSCSETEANIKLIVRDGQKNYEKTEGSTVQRANRDRAGSGEGKKKSFSKSSDSTIEEQRNVQERTYFRS